MGESKFLCLGSAVRVASVGIGLLVGLAGCAFFESSGSFSDSSGSVSDSVGSISDSSTSSSGGGDQAYRHDVRDFTVAIARTRANPDELRRGLAEIALARGMSDWEALPTTYQAVGEGLAEAGVSEEAFLAYRSVLARPGSAGFESLGVGYAASLD